VCLRKSRACGLNLVACTGLGGADVAHECESRTPGVRNPSTQAMGATRVTEGVPFCPMEGYEYGPADCFLRLSPPAAMVRQGRDCDHRARAV